MKRTRSKKSRDTVSLNALSHEMNWAHGDIKKRSRTGKGQRARFLILFKCSTVPMYKKIIFSCEKCQKESLVMLLASV
jgi:hypothetical protein